MVKKCYKHILVTDETYQKLKERGKFLESFNDILSEMLKNN
jgi:predicted CopG family antitoxin